MFLSCNSFSFLHQQCTKALVLELCWIARVDWDDGSVDVKLANYRASALQLWSEALIRNFSEAQKSNKDI